jgi:hypothetical protein
LCFYQDNENDSCQKFTGEQAEEYCQLAGGHAVSLDTNEKVKSFLLLYYFVKETLSVITSNTITCFFTVVNFVKSFKG